MANLPGMLVYTDASQVQKSVENTDVTMFLNEHHVTKQEEFKRKLKQIFQAGSSNLSTFYANVGFSEYTQGTAGGVMPVFGIKGNTPGITRNARFVQLRLGRESECKGSLFNERIFGADFLTGEETVRFSENESMDLLSRTKPAPAMGIPREDRETVCRVLERLWAAQEKNALTRLVVKLADPEKDSRTLLQQVYQLLPAGLRLQMGFETNVNGEDLDWIQKNRLPIYLLTAGEEFTVDETRYLFPIVVFDPGDKKPYGANEDRLKLLWGATGAISAERAAELDLAEAAAQKALGARGSSFAVYEKTLQFFLSGEMKAKVPEGGDAQKSQSHQGKPVYLDMDDILKAENKQKERTAPAETGKPVAENDLRKAPETVRSGQTKAAAAEQAKKSMPQTEEGMEKREQKAKTGLLGGLTGRKSSQDAEEVEVLKRRIKEQEKLLSEEKAKSGRLQKELKALQDKLDKLERELRKLRNNADGAEQPKKDYARSESDSENAGKAKGGAEKYIRRIERLQKENEKLRTMRLFLGVLSAILAVACLVLLLRSCGNDKASDAGANQATPAVTTEAATGNEATTGTEQESTESSTTPAETSSEETQTGEAENAGTTGGTEQTEPATTGGETEQTEPATTGGDEPAVPDEPKNYVSDWEAVMVNGADAGVAGRMGETVAGKMYESADKALYFHIAFAQDAEGTGLSVDTGLPYIGTYVTATTNPNSTNQSVYTFYEASGLNQANGLAGRYLDTVDTYYYLHIAYADDETGATNFAVADAGNQAYIGYYFDNEEADSTDPSAYSWVARKTM